MKREVHLDEIERLYGLNDMVKADCGGCAGCSVCCHGMGNSVILDPLDAYRLLKGLSATFKELLEESAELHVEEGIILPNLKMTGREESCVFLDDTGRCSVHAYRPGLCRIFPLGRYYEGHSFRYYLQSSQCPKSGRTKIKVKKWIDIPDAGQNEHFILEWHDFLKELKERFAGSRDEALQKDVNTFVLNLFYAEPYDMEADFYIQFEERLAKAKKLVSALEW
ncbi:YkgJ family cysteine cluster protein [Qiania dongpingensis]|uniref:YkgJ family cysteine cluster protein n=1 Tax=Qiania dongpingensis TaxID=2763669 RepID=A0A7G9G402_9FIRM|nr:YkgJ family cysteine cluster protein [Qiania dongpingensis]QNM05534.1 YkgJ family cysteine cluster protein [Qiania dongpingensis]